MNEEEIKKLLKEDVYLTQNDKTEKVGEFANLEKLSILLAQIYKQIENLKK